MASFTVPDDPATTGLGAPLLIGDDRLAEASGGSYAHVFAATGQVNATVPLAGAEEVDAAVRSAAAAQREWAALPPDRRRDLMTALARAVEADNATLTRLNVHDFAVPIALSSGLVGLLVRFLDYYAGWTDKVTGQTAPVGGSHDINMIEREPYGVIGVIVPWNGPLVGVGMAVAPALAAGNAVVIKPPELAPLATVRFGELCRQVGLPPGLVNVIPGGPVAGEALVRHPGVAKIHFTGSSGTARKIAVAAAHGLKPLSLELGGKSANIVFADADLDRAVTIAAFTGPVTQSGQSCACGSRILVQRSIYPEFSERLAETVRHVPIGDPFDATTLMGPVVSQAAADRIMATIDDAVRHGTGRLVIGGQRLGGPLADGYFIEPTIFADVPNTSPLARVETFGPVVSLMPFDTEDEAVAIANDSEYGLVAYAHTSSFERAHRVARGLQAGSVWINSFSDIQPSGPYGGYKQSGYGRLGGIEGLHEFSQVKNTRITMGFR